MPAEGALNFDGLMVWSGCWNSRYCVRKGAQRGPRRNVWMGAKRRLPFRFPLR